MTTNNRTTDAGDSATAGDHWPPDPQPDPRGYALTEQAAAEDFAAANYEQLRWTAQTGWLVWDGRRFAIDTTGEVERRAKAANLAIFRHAATIKDDRERDSVLAFGKRMATARGIKAVIELARTDPLIAANIADFDCDPWLLNVLNGTLDLRTGELRPHQQTDSITKLAPVEFNLKAKPPRWSKTLHRVFDGDEGRIAYLQRAFGYSLTGQTGEHTAFIGLGVGRNGKGVTLGTFADMLGDYACVTPFDTFLASRGDGIPNDLARLAGVRFVSASEAPVGRRFNEATIKSYTGGDMITARYLHHEYFEYRPQGKIWMQANHKPAVRDASEGFWSRIRLIPFNVVIPPQERDKHLTEKLRGEWPGILNWAIEGCLAWQRDGLGEPPAVTDATADYRAESDPIADFLRSCCATAANAEATVAALYAAYARWCDDAGERPLAQRQLGSELRQRGFVAVERGRAKVWTWRGLGLRAARDDEPRDDEPRDDEPRDDEPPADEPPADPAPASPTQPTDTDTALLRLLATSGTAAERAAARQRLIDMNAA